MGTKQKKGFLRTARDKMKLCAIAIPLGFLGATSFYSALEVNKSIAYQEIRRLEELDVHPEFSNKRRFRDSIEERIRDLCTNTVPPSLRGSNIYVSQSPIISNLPRYDLDTDTISLPVAFTPPAIAHEIGHKSYSQLRKDEIRTMALLFNKYHEEMSDSATPEIKSYIGKKKTKEEKDKSYKLQGFLIPISEQELEKREFNEEIYAAIFEKYYSFSTANPLKNKSYIQGDKRFREIFDPFFREKYPPTSRKINPEKINIIMGWGDYPRAVYENTKKGVLDVLGLVRDSIKN